MDFIDLKLESTGGTTSVPDEPGVLERYEALGWVRYTPEPEKPFHPAHPNVPENTDWVEMYHPSLKTRHSFPNNPEAISGATETGWLVPKSQPAEPEPVPKPKTAKADSPKEKV